MYSYEGFYRYHASGDEIQPFQAYQRYRRSYTKQLLAGVK